MNPSQSLSHVQFIDSNWGSEISKLRKQEYQKASGFSLDLESLNWKQSDEESYVMAVFAEGQPIASMRGEVLQDLSLVEQKIECPWSFPFQLKTPTLLLSRAATHSAYRTAGLNLLQRYYFIKLALELKIPSLLGTFVSGSPREQSLREMGYDFFENTLGWQTSSYRSNRPVFVVALDLERKAPQALAYCEAQLGKLMDRVPMILKQEEAYVVHKTVQSL